VWAKENTEKVLWVLMMHHDLMMQPGVTEDGDGVRENLQLDVSREYFLNVVWSNSYCNLNVNDYCPEVTMP
jgi:hypothetical protein